LNQLENPALEADIVAVPEEAERAVGTTVGADIVEDQGKIYLLKY
jgi:hypothetical protein